jgi:hypothetical protein
LHLLVRLATPELGQSRPNPFRSATRRFPLSIHFRARVKRFDLSKLLQQRSFERQLVGDLGIRLGRDADALRESLLDPRAGRQSH